MNRQGLTWQVESRPHPEAGPREPRMIAAIETAIKRRTEPQTVSRLLYGLYLNRFVPGVTRSELRVLLHAMVTAGRLVTVEVPRDGLDEVAFELPPKKGEQ
jgi:hypothetical protein